MQKLDSCPPGTLSRNASAPSRAVASLSIAVETFDSTPRSSNPLIRRSSDEEAVLMLEQLMRGAPSFEDLQDRMASTMRWAEGRQISTSLLEQLGQQFRRVLSDYFEEHQPRTSRSFRDILADVQVIAQGSKVTFELPVEVRQWLAPRSMISF